MPPQPTPLRAISGNQLPGCELSPYIRGQVIGQRECGQSPTEIARGINLSVSSVKYTLAQAPLRHEGKSIPRAPRKKSYTDTDERHLLRHVRANPKDTYKQALRRAA
ncbi:hypothetical protein BJ875DRAFT_544203 [Amylocarpus encephaloides]|uniref:Transposase IS30-like HTH domain-containing protein n=1 Tax=Amylocarpus encephaloides TaxID=45428 RepID=A0A9P8C473_9HELO|nr:hypothetical protein BJ875DRAFT_544203 [Amylocarpus encephaloides]